MLLCIVGAFEDGRSSELHWKSQVLMNQNTKFLGSFSTLYSPPLVKIFRREALSNSFGLVNVAYNIF